MIRTLLTTVTAGVALAAAAGCSGASAEPLPAAAKPTVVLVHGAFADSSSWNGVIKNLAADGYPVIAAANPLRGLHSDAEYVRSVLNSVPGPVVLAGHSYGGSVMSQAAAEQPNVKALVYIASFLLEEGESTSELAGKFPGAELGPALDPVTFPLPDGNTGEDLYIRQDEFRRVFAADVPPDVADLMAATQRPITAAALAEPASKAAWKTIPSWNMVTTGDLAIPAESMRFMGERAGATNSEIDASHAVTVSQPDAVADLIKEAANAATT
ncbi:alpha/beta fold hydrolase [Mycobacterium sp. PS03-16]|uniref:alpha/beta fold hydrolase n=1 Tax=Mycobacterium sp. PS03-16 TaxID=2559611 RepID=UPI001ADD69E4|nr:alpha/beta hydrolase [Mycobacterium sp. PS03-16]